MKLSVSTTQRENWLGWIYLLLSLFILPSILFFLNEFLPKPLSDTKIHLINIAINFMAVILIFQRFLTASVKVAANKPGRVLGFAALGFVLYYVLSVVIAGVILRISPDFSNVNDSTVIGLFVEHPALMAIATVLLVPVTEETLYRGLLFQGFQRKSRLLAYCLSTLVFASIHVVSYIGQTDWLTLALCFAQYLPAGLMLAWAYEKSNTIMTPIMIHMVINLIGTSVSR